MCGPAWRSCRTCAAASRHDPADRGARRLPDRRARDRRTRQRTRPSAGGRRCTRPRTRAETFADKYGVERVSASYADVVDDPEVDVVYNPLANSLHAPWNLAAIAAGKPVLTEKPFARNHSEAQRVADAAEAAGVTVMEGFHYCFHPVDPPRVGAGRATARSARSPTSRCGWRCPHPRQRPALVTRDGRRRADGPRLLRPAPHASLGSGPPVDHPCARQGTHAGRRRMVRRRGRLSRRSHRPERQLDGRRRPLVHPSHRRHQGRCAGAQLHQAPRRRPV